MQKIVNNTLVKRKSNIELLRITSMILVLLCHYVTTRSNGVISSTAIPESISPLDTDRLNIITNLELRSLSIVCTHCFILISGYFGIRYRFKSFANLIFQMFFWSVTCIVISYIVFKDMSVLPSIKTFASNIVHGWFPEGYLILFAVSPILNSFIETCTNKQLGKYILLFYTFSTIFGYILGFHDFGKGMSAISMCGLYLLGAYIRNSNIKIFTLKPCYDLLIYVGLGFGLVALNMLLLNFRIYTSPYGYLNPIVILMAIYLFLFFKNTSVALNFQFSLYVILYQYIISVL